LATRSLLFTQHLLKRKANPNIAEELTKIADDFFVGGESALELAVESGDVETYKVLRKYGADQHVRNRRNQTLLHVAVNSQSYEIVPLVVDDKIDVNVLDDEGMSALMMLLSQEELSYDPDDPESEDSLFTVMKYIVDAGVSRQQKPIEGKSALALSKNHPRLYEYLATHGFKEPLINS